MNRHWAAGSSHGSARSTVVDGDNLLALGSRSGCLRSKESSQEMAIGTVKFFNDQKGFGFISREGESDLFVHFSNIDGVGRKTLNEGDQVEYEVGEGRKGPEAVSVRVV
jgi:CspA family cold shock protein